MKHSFPRLAAASLALGLLGAGQAAQAQNSAVNNALLSLKAGPTQYDKALASINQAVENEKTKNSAKAWFTRGDVYYTVLDPSTQALYSKYTSSMQPGEALRKAAESYKKAQELDAPGGEYAKLVPGRLQNLYGLAFNDGVKYYNAGKDNPGEYDKAISSYQLASSLMPKDTTAVLYTAYAQEAKQDLTGAKASYNQLLGMGYKSVPVYTRLLQIDDQQKDQADMQKVLAQALAAYPNNKTFLIQDLNMSMGGAGGGAGAIDKINKAIAADPNNSNLYAVRGSVYDSQKKTDLAMADYKKAIELDPKNFDAQYNMGIYNFNQAATLYTKASKMDLKTYQTKGGKAIEAEGKKYFEASVPYFEQALVINPNDPGALNALQKVYARLNRPADAKRMEDRLNALKK